LLQGRKPDLFFAEFGEVPHAHGIGIRLSYLQIVVFFFLFNTVVVLLEDKGGLGLINFEVDILALCFHDAQFFGPLNLFVRIKTSLERYDL